MQAAAPAAARGTADEADVAADVAMEEVISGKKTAPSGPSLAAKDDEIEGLESLVCQLKQDVAASETRAGEADCT